MAISSVNGKLAIMEFDEVYEPGLPISPGTIDQADQQQFLWGFPEILWAPFVAPTYVAHTYFTTGRTPFFSFGDTV